MSIGPPSNKSQEEIDELRERFLKRAREHPEEFQKGIDAWSERDRQRREERQKLRKKPLNLDDYFPEKVYGPVGRYFLYLTLWAILVGVLLGWLFG